MIKNNRLEAIAKATKGIKTLLDIGCDHGLVIKKAFELGNIQKAIAADINVGPLNSARKNLFGYNVSYVVSDGFKEIKEEFDGVVIAGMGAHLICKILKDSPDGKITYILQPNSKYEVLRKFLSENNYKIVDENVIFDKFYYIMIKAVRKEEKLTDEEIYLGPVLMKKASSKEYYQKKLKRYNHLITLNTAARKDLLQKVKWLEDMIKN